MLHLFRTPSPKMSSQVGFQKPHCFTKRFSRPTLPSKTLSTFLLLRLLKHLLYNLLFLDQERAHHTVFDAVGTSRPAVGALDRLLWPRDGGVFPRAQGRDLFSLSVDWEREI